ncbi:hypothetical protein DPX16_4320 [Anabarilius grahami]|uniref:Uncharacterized protein n=1 Tax=Anabarilius grahami TaxID=495550 RepID=A0A3N0YEJ7_ANAGA|nr:hypothetical protein DPX16_4320 [Anabarilius grahami]
MFGASRLSRTSSPTLASRLWGSGVIIIIIIFLILWINDVPIEKSSSEGHDDEGVHQLLDQNKAVELAQLCEMAAGPSSQHSLYSQLGIQDAWMCEKHNSWLHSAIVASNNDKSQSINQATEDELAADPPQAIQAHATRKCIEASQKKIALPSCQ